MESWEVTMEFGVLGPLRLAIDGREFALDSPKQRSLLGMLVINAGRVVSSDRLAEVLWGDHQPEDASGALHTHVSRLRALLGRWGGETARQAIRTRPPGYVLAVTPEQVDALVFEGLVGEARVASAPQRVARLLGEALDLWRGDPLVDFDHEFAISEASRLDELRSTAEELRADALLTLGRYSEVVEDLTISVRRHPFREKLRGQLMVALYECRRPADALAAYRDLRDTLGAELGVEPSPALRRLEGAILQQETDLPWPSPSASEPHYEDARDRDRRTTGELLPEEPNSFIGREDDIPGVTTALDEGRVVVLTGVGGVGKSRLAVRVAREVAADYPDGVRICDLVEAIDSGSVSSVVATSLGVPSGERGGSEDAVVESLRAQRLLLVLDNCEHVLTGVARLVDRIGRTCPDVDVLATSRQPLGVIGQRVWPVEPLTVGEGTAAAATLFCHRAAAADPSFQPDAHQSAIVEICRQLDGLPLAIELAAARVRSMTPADIADRLDRRFDLLTADNHMIPPRHRSLHAVVDWSYALLPAGSGRLFDRLAIFAGGFELTAAEKVCSGDGLTRKEMAGRVAELVDHSLVVADRTRAHARYRLLETLRSYGRSRLEEREELTTWQERHADYFASLAEDAAGGMLGADEGQWVRTVDTEFANFRAAQAWAMGSGRADLALGLPVLLRVYAYYRLRHEVFDWVLQALELPAAGRWSEWAAAWVTAGVGWMQRGDLHRAHRHAEETLAAATEEGVVLRARQLLAEVALYQGKLQESERRGAEIVKQAQESGNAYYESLGHLYRVFAATYLGRTEEAMARLREGWMAVEVTGNPTLEAGYRYLEGEVRLDADPDEALTALGRAIEISRSVGNRFIEGVARVTAASLEARHGHPHEALQAFREIVDHWRASGDWAHMWTTLRNLLLLLERIGARRPAAVLLGAAQTATTGARAFGSDARRLEMTAASLRRSLGETDYESSTGRGRDMADEEAVLYALKEIDRLLVDGTSTDAPRAPDGPEPPPPSEIG